MAKKTKTIVQPKNPAKQKEDYNKQVERHETREKKQEYDGLTLSEMRRKHSIPVNVGGQELLNAYRADNVDTVRKEESAEEIAHQRKVLDQAKMELEWDRKERDSRKDLEEYRDKLIKEKSRNEMYSDRVEINKMIKIILSEIQSRERK